MFLPPPLHSEFEKEVINFKVHLILIWISYNCLEVTGVNKAEVQRSMMGVRGAPWQYHGLGPAEGDCEAAP